ncbi:MAG: hypothetical protein H7Z40_05575 [Phycisphaerae bacterium]|nr:hypothetical protein [Gemmatimonadaceae bacterium]
MSSRAAIVCVVLATVFAVACHPRIFFGSGDGPAGSIVNLDSVFFLGQWASVLFSVMALVLAALLLRSGNSSPATVVVLGGSLLLLILQIATGIPHPANRNEWSNRELGAVAFMRGVAKRAKTNAKPVLLTAASFAGQWQSHDGSVYVFAPDSVAWTGSSNGAISRDTCGQDFLLEYMERERDVLLDYGLTWSPHAGAVHDTTATDARIPVLHAACATGNRFVFIRATENEVWRWTNSMNANDFKGTTFILRRVPD